MGPTGDHYLEQIAADALEILWLCGALQEVAKLVVVDLRSGGIVQEPVGCTANSGNSDIGSNRHIPVKTEDWLSYNTTEKLSKNSLRPGLTASLARSIISDKTWSNPDHMLWH